jgi:hypothetical protein
MLVLLDNAADVAQVRTGCRSPDCIVIVTSQAGMSAPRRTRCVPGC